jgi:PST family polysaccharide transporter
MYSDEIVRFLFGDKWTGVTLPFSILIGALYFRLAYRITEAMAFSKNALAGTALRQTLYGAMVVGGSLIGSKWGVAGIAVGVTAALAVFFVLSAGYANRLSRTSLSQFVSAHAPAVFLTAVVVACISMLKSMFLCHFSPLNSLLGGATAFLLISAAFVLFGPEFLFGDSALRAVRSSFQARFFGYPRL